jgi:hypothetical protein
MSGVGTSTPAQRFRRWRLGVRASFLLGIAVLVGPKLLPDGLLGATQREVTLYLALALLAATFPLYYLYANRCPRCRRRFSEAPEYTSSETSGLPLFTAIDTCPFCGLGLHEVERSQDRGS